MKKLLFLSLILNFSVYSFCQESESRLGCVIQPTISTLYGVDYLDDYSSRICFSGGIEYEYLFTNHVSIKTGLVVDRKGAKSEMSLTNARGEYMGKTDLIMKYDYFTVPFLFSLSSASKTRIFFNVGPSFGYLISQKYVIGGVSDIPKLTEDNSSNTTECDLGIVIGIGFDTSLNEEIGLGIELRDNIGLINTNKIDNDLIKTNICGLLISIKFGL